MQGIQRRIERDELDASMAERLSTRLRMARHRRGMTLKRLADTAGCSESLLSKIENGKAYPSLPMLNRLSLALDSSIGWLFDGRDAAGPAPSRAGARDAATDPAIIVEAVVQSMGDHLLRCDILHLEAGATGRAERDQAGRAAGYLLDGEVELAIEGQAQRLKAGDAFAFRSDQPHGFRNIGTVRASLFWVNTLPPA